MSSPDLVESDDSTSEYCSGKPPGSPSSYPQITRISQIRFKKDAQRPPVGQLQDRTSSTSVVGRAVWLARTTRAAPPLWSSRLTRPTRFCTGESSGPPTNRPQITRISQTKFKKDAQRLPVEHLQDRTSSTSVVGRAVWLARTTRAAFPNLVESGDSTYAFL